MKKLLFVLLPISLFILSCENKVDEPYIELQSMSYDNGYFMMVTYVVEGYYPPIEHIETKSCVWLRLYKDDDKCECRTPNTSEGDWEIYTKNLDGINYSYVTL